MHTQLEYIIVFIHSSTGASSNISLGLIANILCDNGGLIAAKCLHGATYMECGRYVFEFYFINSNPIIHCGCQRGETCEISACWQRQGAAHPSELTFEGASLENEIPRRGSTGWETDVELSNITQLQCVRKRHTERT